MPELFGWTPSPVSVAALNPVHWSTTVIGDRVVLFALAQAGIAALRFTTRCPHGAQLLGLIGRIWATRIFMAGLLARIWSTSLPYALRMVAGKTGVNSLDGANQKANEFLKK